MLTKMVNGEHDLETLSRVSSIKEAQELAAELHDGLGQELAGISLLVSVLRRIPLAQHPDLRGPLANIAGLIVQAIVSCRRVAEGRGGFLVQQRGLTEALLHLTSQFGDGATRVEFYGKDIPKQRLDEATAYCLFRIGREAICNAFRHSRAKRIQVTCDHTDDAVRLSVEDDGIGLSEALGCKGIGISIMEFRARSIGADLAFAAVSTGGLKVTCCLEGCYER